MTITSTGPSGFHLKPVVTVFVAAAIVASIIAIGLWVGTDDQPIGTPRVETPAVVATPDVAPNANWDAYAAGKLDDAPLPPLSPAAATSRPGTASVPGDVQSANLDALATGKLDMELAAENPSLYYGAAAVDRTTANWVAYATGKLDDAPAAVPSPTAISSAPGTEAAIAATDHEALALAAYGTAAAAADRTTANWAAFEAGKLDDATSESETTTRPPAMTGGHQEY